MPAPRREVKCCRVFGPAGTDRALLALADQWGAPTPRPALDTGGPVDTIRLAVVGAHLEGMPLHWQLTSRAATLIAATQTAPCYRLYAMADSVPPKPALVHSEEGAAIALEVYELDLASFGSFVAEVPPPLAIGTVTLADGSSVKGFVAEPRAMTGAEDITHLGGWRAFIASLRSFLKAAMALAEASSNLWPPAVVVAVGGVSSLSPILMTVAVPAGTASLA